MVAAETTHRGPSRTAYNVALLRAQHQVVEGGSIFSDPFAVPIAGESEENLTAGARKFPLSSPLRQFVAARSRFAEDCLAKAVERGTRQVVILGAGLDTFGLRNPYTDKAVRVFEVDRPATQRWKRQRLAAANLRIPDALTFVTVDFENQSFLARLASEGFKSAEPAFFVWLGVISYLTRKANAATLTAIASIPDGEVVFDYGEPLAAIPPAFQGRYQSMIKRMGEWGEPWVSFFTPREMRFGLSKLGFMDIEDVGPEDVGARYFCQGRPFGGHLVRARKLSSSA